MENFKMYEWNYVREREWASVNLFTPTIVTSA